MSLSLRHIILLVLWLGAFVAYPQSDTLRRPIRSVYALEWGAASITDTYLSPLRYSGQSVAVSGEWSKAIPGHERNLRMAFDAEVRGDFGMQDRALAISGLTVDAGWRLQWHAVVAQRLNLGVGGRCGINTGVLYKSSGGNNPASAIASAGLAMTASASLPVRIGRKTVTFLDNVEIPSLSVFFAPEYGETYYEIWLGNRSGLAHAGWWGNAFGIGNLLAADLPLGKAALRIGYRFSLTSRHANSLSQIISTHSLVIGIIPKI